MAISGRMREEVCDSRDGGAHSDGGGADARERVLRSAANGGQMSHLAARASASLSIEMQAHAGLRQRGLERRWPMLPQFAEQVEDCSRPKHGRVAQRKIANRADDLLELARRTGNFRLVIRVVRSRRQLVD